MTRIIFGDGMFDLGKRWKNFNFISVALNLKT
jgi:hypothetical protein